MTTDESTTDQAGTTTRRADSRGLAQQYWTTMARTADLVRKLTALADRYEAALEDGGRPEAGTRHRVALMRATADAGRQLIRSRAPDAFPSAGQSAASPLERRDGAGSRDVRASGRDAAAQLRDERAAERDSRVRDITGDDDVDFSGRFLAACDRDDAAGDRADALADRRAAQRDRSHDGPGSSTDEQARTYALVTRLEERAVVRQAQGILMHRAGLTAGEAFEALLLAATGPMTLDSVAEHVVRESELPVVPDAP